MKTPTITIAMDAEVSAILVWTAATEIALIFRQAILSAVIAQLRAPISIAHARMENAFA
jgi:hypothetical protein